MTTSAPTGLPAQGLSPAHLTRARLRIAWDMLSQVGEQADLLPLAARPHVAQALASLVQAKALVDETPGALAP